MERKDWTLVVYRCSKSRTLRGKYEYCNKTKADMDAEIRDLTAKLYPVSQFEIELYETGQAPEAWAPWGYKSS